MVVSPRKKCSHIIHAASTAAITTLNNATCLAKFDTVVQGTRRVLEQADQCGAKKALLPRWPPKDMYLPAGGRN